MADADGIIEGTVEAQIGIRVSEPHSNWRIIGTVALPFKLQVHGAPTDKEQEID